MSARLGCDPGGRPAKNRRSKLGRLGRFVVTLLGTFLPLGIAHPAPFAEANAERPVIERVEIIRERLFQGYRQNLLHPEWPRLAQWGNWPNWGNWGNWPNWNNWGGQVPRRVGRWRWPGR